MSPSVCEACCVEVEVEAEVEVVCDRPEIDAPLH